MTTIKKTKRTRPLTVENLQRRELLAGDLGLAYSAPDESFGVFAFGPQQSKSVASTVTSRDGRASLQIDQTSKTITVHFQNLNANGNENVHFDINTVSGSNWTLRFNNLLNNKKDTYFYRNGNQIAFRNNNQFPSVLLSNSIPIDGRISAVVVGASGNHLMHPVIHFAQPSPSNSAPTAITPSSMAIGELAAVGSLVGNLAAQDPDIDDTHTFVINNDAGGLFALQGNSVVVANPLDHEQSNSHTITVTATDGGNLSVTQNLVINVSDANEAPTDITAATNVIDNDSPIGTVAAMLAAVDPDAGDSHTFTLIDDAEGRFRLEQNQIQVADSSRIDGAVSTFTLLVRATDVGGLFVQKGVTIVIRDDQEFSFGEVINFDGHVHIVGHNAAGFNDPNSVFALNSMGLEMALEGIADEIDAFGRSAIVLTQHYRNDESYNYPIPGFESQLETATHQHNQNSDSDVGIHFGSELTYRKHTLKLPGGIDGLAHVAQSLLKASGTSKPVEALNIWARDPGKYVKRWLNLKLSDYSGKSVLVEMPKKLKDNGDAVRFREARIRFTESLVHALMEAGARVGIIGSSDAHSHFELGAFQLAEPLEPERHTITRVILDPDAPSTGPVQEADLVEALKAARIFSVDDVHDLELFISARLRDGSTVPMGSAVDFANIDRLEIATNNAELQVLGDFSVRQANGTFARHTVVSEINDGNVEIDIPSGLISGVFFKLVNHGEVIGWSSGFTSDDGPTGSDRGDSGSDQEVPIEYVNGPFAFNKSIDVANETGVLSFKDVENVNDEIRIHEANGILYGILGNANVFRISASKVKKIEIRASRGNDVVTINLQSSIKVDVYGGRGADNISVSNPNAQARLFGGRGIDRLSTLDGDNLDRILGGLGNDLVFKDQGDRGR